MDSKEVLKELGLTDGEVKVYFALFELGETKVGPISKKSTVTHAKVYPILDKLIQKGLVSHTIKEGRKHFTASDASNLLDFVDNKVKNLEDEKEKIEKIIPSLELKRKKQEKVQYSRVFEGIRGLKTLFKEIFSTPANEICVFGLDEIIAEEKVMQFIFQYHKLRLSKKINLKLILSPKLKDLFNKKYKNQELYSNKDMIRFVEVNFPTGIFIYKDHVISIVSEDNLTAFDVKSKQNTKRYQKFFNKIWEASKKR
jgi:HTH-type transcriptional regulator, sugar sensing transcriptional regulator